MKRRGFLAALLSAPVAAKVASAASMRAASHGAARNIKPVSEDIFAPPIQDASVEVNVFMREDGELAYSLVGSFERPRSPMYAGCKIFLKSNSGNTVEICDIYDYRDKGDKATFRSPIFKYDGGEHIDVHFASYDIAGRVEPTSLHRSVFLPRLDGYLRHT